MPKNPHFPTTNVSQVATKTNIEQVIGDSDVNVRGNFKEAQYEVKIELC